MTCIVKLGRFFILLHLFVLSAYSQNLIISNSGQTTSPGTNWSITGNTLNVAASGTANVHPNVISNHLNNVGDLTVILPRQSGQNRQCSIDGSITYTGSATRTLTFLIANDIFITTPNQSISATGSGALNVVLRAANTDVAPSNGHISIRENNTINTNGGHLWIGGGSGNVTWNGLAVGNDFARTWAANIPGLWIENATLITNGGNFEAKGQSWYSQTTAATLNHGIRISGSSISSGNGSVVINGSIQGNFNNGIATLIEESTTNGANVSTTSGSITITGVGTSTSNPGWRHGIVVQGIVARPTSISTVSGNISVHGTANYNGFNDQSGLQIQGDDTRIVSQTGNITLKGTNPHPAFGQFSNAVRFQNPNVTNALRIGFDGTNAYSGNILIEGNSLYQRLNNTGTGSISIQTTGDLTIQPEGDAFTHLRADASGTLTFDNDWNFGTNLGSFTFGKTTNTSDITFSNDIITNGPITVYANKIIMGNTPTISASESARLITSGSNGHISLLAKNGFETLESSACVRGKIMTSGGNIHITADADNNNTGTLNLDWLTIDHSTGSLLFEGAGHSWNIGNTSVGGHCPLPELYGSGSITFRPTNNSTQNFHTSWISLIGNKASLTLGSSTNNFQNIIIEPCTSCLGTPINGSGQTITTTNGPIEAHGFIIEVKTNLKTTGSGDNILLRAQRRLQIYDGTASTDYRSLQANNGDIVLWTNTINEIPGGVVIGDWITLNSANGNTNQSTGGGKIWIAGGSAVNSDGLPTGPANGGVSRSGVSFGTFSSGSTTTSLYSGGGAIFIHGESNASSGLGVSWNRTGICHAGNGIITLKGEGKNTSGAHGVELGAYSGSIDFLSNGGSSNSAAISIEGKTARNDFSGIQTAGNRIQATGAGGISIVSIANNGGTSWSNNLGTNLLAASGDIFVSAQGGTGLRYGGTIGKLAGSNVTTSSSNITLRANQITVQNGITVDATGTLVVEPFGTSFTNALTWPIANFSTVNGLTGLRLGKDGNLGNITVSSPQSINGPISIFGGIITTNANLIASAINSTILIKGIKIIQNQGVLVQSNRGNISYEVSNSPWNANSDDQGIALGVLDGSTASIDAQGGNISLTASFANTGNTNTGSFADVAIRFRNVEIKTNRTGSISIDGNGYNNASNSGDYIWGLLMHNTVIQSDTGSISITGTGGRSITNSRGIIADNSSLKILSKLGAITLTDAMPIGHIGSNYTGAYFRPSSVNAIQFGADGNLVSSSNSNVIFNVDRVTFDAIPSTINTLGTVLIRPSGNDFTSGVDLTQLSIDNSSGFTVGKSATSADGVSDASVSLSTCSIPGPIDVYGGSIAINQNLNTSTGNSTANILLKSSTNIVLASNRSIITNGGDVSFWADSDGNGSGYIQLAGGSNSGISSGGGNVFLGGGSDLATGYARGAAIIALPGIYTSGVHLSDGTTINSGGGNITLRGQNVGNSDAFVQAGIMGINTILDAGTGKIALVGLAGGSGQANSQGISRETSNSWIIRSSNPDSDAISLIGDASSTNNSGTSLGINFIGKIESTGGGGIYMYGKAGTATNYDHGLDIRGEVLANSGNITFVGENDVASQIGLFFDQNTSIGSKVGTNVLSSASDIVLKSNNLVFNNSTAINTSGEVSLLPLDADNSFGVAHTIGSNTQLSSNVSGLTIGKPTNSANITVASPNTIAGPISIYGGTVALNENIASSNGSTITLFANTLNFASGKTVTSNNGQLIVAPQDLASTIGLADATGTLQLPESYFSTNFTDGFSEIQIGTSDYSGAIATNAFTLRDSMSLLTTGALTLGGNPVLGANNLTLGAGITTINNTNSNYFQTNGTGKVIRTIPTGSNLLFPIGKLAYNPLSAKNNTGTEDVFSARVLDSVFLNGTTGPLITTPHVRVTWDISKTNPNASSGVDFEFGWNADQEVGTISSYELNHYDDGINNNWSFAAGTSNAPSGTTTKTMSHTGYTGTFSPFAISQGTSALPVELLSFTAQCEDNSVKLRWQTASELNASHFEVERSVNANDWEQIGVEAAAGNSTEVRSYTFEDNSTVARSLMYYRLVQVDFDGNAEVLGPVYSNCTSDEGWELAVAPNPTNGNFGLYISSETEQTVNIQILGSDGKIIADQWVQIPIGTSTHYMRLYDAAPGMYSVFVQHKAGTSYQKLVVN